MTAPHRLLRARRVVTTRAGGVSAAPYDSFNLADHVGDDPAAVAANRRRLASVIGLPPERFAALWPRELSGGERQRVGVARALVGEPSLLLMDEPFGALDPITRFMLQREFAAWQRRLGTSVVLVTHDVAEALRLGDVVAVMTGGRLVQSGTPAELLPRDWRSGNKYFFHTSSPVAASSAVMLPRNVQHSYVDAPPWPSSPTPAIGTYTRPSCTVTEPVAFA